MYGHAWRAGGKGTHIGETMAKIACAPTRAPHPAAPISRLVWRLAIYAAHHAHAVKERGPI